MLPTTLRNALLSIAVFLPAHVLADDDDGSDIVTFQFSACVSTCLGTTGYSMDGEDKQKEMCKASRDGLLEAITACLVSSCLEELVAVDANLLQPMQTGCKELEKPVSDDEIEDAASAAANIQATLAASTSTSTTSPVPELVTIIPAIPSFQPLGAETEASTTSDLLTTMVPAETSTTIEPAAEAMASSVAPTTVTQPTISQLEPDVPAETQTPTPDLSISSETQPPPEPVSSAEPSSSSAAAAIVPVAQITDISPAQPAPDATTVAEPPSSPAPSPPPAAVSTSTAGGDHANQIQSEATPETTVVKPTSTDNASAQQQPQQTTAPEQSHANNHTADATTSAEASKTQGSEPKATHTAGISNSSSQHSDDDDDDDDEEDSSASGTSTTTPDISGELVLATGTPTASASSQSGFATSVTAVAATPSASGTQAAAPDDVDGGLGGGSPFSVVMASAATSQGNAPCWWALVSATMMGMLVSLTL